MRSERTNPERSRWDQDDAEFVASDTAWCERCASALMDLDSSLEHPAALVVAFRMSERDAVRALSPEAAAASIRDLP